MTFSQLQVHRHLRRQDHSRGNSLLELLTTVR